MYNGYDVEKMYEPKSRKELNEGVTYARSMQTRVTKTTVMDVWYQKKRLFN